MRASKLLTGQHIHQHLAALADVKFPWPLYRSLSHRRKLKLKADYASGKYQRAERDRLFNNYYTMISNFRQAQSELLLARAVSPTGRVTSPTVEQMAANPNVKEDMLALNDEIRNHSKIPWLFGNDSYGAITYGFLKSRPATKSSPNVVLDLDFSKLERMIEANLPEGSPADHVCDKNCIY